MLANVNMNNFSFESINSIKVKGLGFSKRHNTSKMILKYLNENRELQEYLENHNINVLVECKNKTTSGKHPVIEAKFINFIRKIQNFIEMNLGSGNLLNQKPLIKIKNLISVSFVEKDGAKDVKTLITRRSSSKYDKCLDEVLNSLKRLTSGYVGEMKSIQHFNYNDK